eukprot:3637407-Prymnesium_polylepis.3
MTQHMHRIVRAIPKPDAQQAVTDVGAGRDITDEGWAALHRVIAGVLPESVAAAAAWESGGGRQHRIAKSVAAAIGEAQREVMAMMAGRWEVMRTRREEQDAEDAMDVEMGRAMDAAEEAERTAVQKRARVEQERAEQRQEAAEEMGRRSMLRQGDAVATTRVMRGRVAAHERERERGCTSAWELGRACVSRARGSSGVYAQHAPACDV